MGTTNRISCTEPVGATRDHRGDGASSASTGVAHRRLAPIACRPPVVPRARITRTASVFGLLAVVATALLFFGSCGSEEAGDEILTIEQALAGEEGRLIKVQGAVVATETQVVLASALMESYPPQAGKATLPVEGLDLTALVGLSSTAGQPDLAQVTWSDYWVVLEGVINEGVLEVRGTPPVTEAVTAEVRVRFGLESQPLLSGETVWWVFDVTNLTAQALDLTFPSGQMGEVVLAQAGVEQYRWSAGKSFIAAIRVDTLQPGQTLPYILNDSFQVTPGDYDLAAKVTASVGSESEAVALPEIATTVRVR